MTDFDPNYRPEPEPVDEEQDKRERAAANKFAGFVLVFGLLTIGAIIYFMVELSCLAPSNQCIWPFYH